MKIQDLSFFIVLIAIILFKKKKLFVIGGLFCFLLATPLFYLKIFFTAQRLIWYGTGMIFLFVLTELFLMKNNENRN